MFTLPLTDEGWLLSKRGVWVGAIWELPWKVTEGLVMQHSGISFSVMVSERDYPWLFLICGLSGNAFGESGNSLRLCVLSVLREATGWTRSWRTLSVYLLCISLPLYPSTCLDAVLLLVLIPWQQWLLSTWTALFCLHTVSLVAGFASILFHAFTLNRDPLPSSAWSCRGGSGCWCLGRLTSRMVSCLWHQTIAVAVGSGRRLLG